MTTLQLLTPTGERIPPDPVLAHPATPEQMTDLAAELTPSALRDAYRHMVLTRAFDREATSLQRQGELGLWVPSLGQEAAQVGSAMATPAADMVYPSYREHGVAQVRGLDLREIIPVYRGTRHGGWDPRAHNFHIYTFVIGAHSLHAVGHAMGLQQDRRRGIADGSEAVVVYFGDGATSQGDVNEALVFASSAEAPVLFFLQNNHWAISVRSERQSRFPLANRADGFGIPHLRVDGNDVIATYAATRYALTHIKQQGGPFFIEAVTYRMGAHTTSDDPTRYRSREEEEEWRGRDPIARLRTLLAAEGTEPGFFDAVDEEARQLGAAVRTFTRENAPGDFTTIFDHVTASPNAQVERERAEWDAYLARGEN